MIDVYLKRQTPMLSKNFLPFINTKQCRMLGPIEIIYVPSTWVFGWLLGFVNQDDNMDQFLQIPSVWDSISGEHLEQQSHIMFDFHRIMFF